MDWAPHDGEAGMGHSVRSLLLVIAAAALHAPPVGAQLPLWGFGAAATTPAAQADWKPEAFADYLSSGQPPHHAVVRIIAPESSGTSMGSGVLVDINRTQGLVLTNWHVIRNSTSAVLVQFPDGFQAAGTVVKSDEPWDLAAIAIWRPNTTPVVLAATPPQIGEPLSIAGYGKGPYRSQTGACTQYLSPSHGYPLEFVELEATARQGDSGGPILNSRGELSGILFGQAQGRTIGACSTRLRAFLAELGSTGYAGGAVVAAPSFPPSSSPIDPLAPASGVAVVASIPRETSGLPPPPSPAVTDSLPNSPFDSQAPAAFASFPVQAAAASPSPQPIPAAAAPPLSSTGAPPMTAPPPMWGGGGPAPADGLPIGTTIEELLDFHTNGRALLTAAGGAVLVLAGLRTVIGGRRSHIPHSE